MYGGGGRSNYNGGGSRGGRGRGRGYNTGRTGGRPPNPTGPPSLVRICNRFASGQACDNKRCHFSHAIMGVTTIQNSILMPPPNNGNNGYHNQNHHQSYHPTSDVTLWTDPSTNSLKIFTSSHDGHWRLYNTSSNNTNTTNSNSTLNIQINKEFEHAMGGPIDIITVASGYLFCGFSGPSIRIPGDTKVGMIHCWNLGAPNNPPVELTMHPDLAPYAHSGRVSAFLTGIGDLCISGGKDGVIRVWKYGSQVTGGNPGFLLVKECCGHVGEITGLLVVGGILWSCSTDATIRLWDAGAAGGVGTGTWECKYLITASTPPSGAGANAVQSPSNGGVAGVGHTKAITSLLLFEGSGGSFVMSSSLDGDVKVWDSTNGECKSTTNHGVGIVCMAISLDKDKNSVLLCGTETGKIMVRMIFQTTYTNEPMRLLASLDVNYIHVGHEGPVKQIKAGPENTFYSVGSDGNLIVWQIVNSFKPP